MSSILEDLSHRIVEGSAGGQIVLYCKVLASYARQSFFSCIVSVFSLFRSSAVSAVMDCLLWGSGLVSGSRLICITVFKLAVDDIYTVACLFQAAASAEPVGTVLLERLVVRRVARLAAALET